MIDEEENVPREMASRKASWPAFALAISALFAGLFGAVESLFTNLITIFSLHLNYQYDEDDKARECAPHIRTE